MGIRLHTKRRRTDAHVVWETVRAQCNPLSAAGVRTHELEALAAARAVVLLEAQHISPGQWLRLKRELKRSETSASAEETTMQRPLSSTATAEVFESAPK